VTETETDKIARVMAAVVKAATGPLLARIAELEAARAADPYAARLSAVETRCDAMDGDMGDMNDQMAGCAEDITAHEARMTAIEAMMAELMAVGKAVGEVNERVLVMREDLALAKAMTFRVDAIEARPALQDEVLALQVEVEAVRGVALGLSGQVQELEARPFGTREFWNEMSSAATVTRERLEALEQRAAVPGPAGIAGKDGAPGLTGKDGADGLAGRDGAPGVSGKDGDAGPAGADGQMGSQGERGLSAEPDEDDIPDEEMTAAFTELLRKELALEPMQMQRRVIRDAHGKIERVVEEPV
jgi:hypothetical protein